MAHFAQIDADNIVVRVLVVPDEQEHRGQEFLANDLQLGGNWVQTSYNNRIRRRFAGVGFTYDPIADVFLRPRPYPSWILDNDYSWQAPTPKPDNNPLTYWDEETLSWIQPSDLPT
jgi:hypothetical protein